MYIQTILYALHWWLIIFGIGIITFPVTSLLFKNFADRGYLFSRVIGIILISYTSLLFGALHILPFSTISLWLLMGILGGINGYVLYKKRHTFKEIKGHFALPFIEEVLFLLGLIAWSFIRGFQPDIHSLEKFMDFGFVNSILRSTYFPPRDMWMTPLSINYYYFGHLVTAVLTKISSLPSSITFNLMIATLFSLTFSLSFSLGGNLWHLFKTHQAQTLKHQTQTFLIAGLLSAFLVTFAGNLHTVYTFFTPYQNDNPVPPWELTFSPQTFPNSYWYPNATRFIYHTIHEFPIYSFVVSDLHGHVLDIPFVLLMLALLITVVITPQKNFHPYLLAIFLGGVSAIMYMTNAWDGLIYVFFSEVILIYKLSKDHVIGIFKEVLSTQSLMAFILILVSFVVVSLPFSVFFKPFASEVGINCAPDFLIKLGTIGPLIFEKGYCQFSPWWQLIILYGFFLFWVVSFFVLLLKKLKKNTIVNPLDSFVLLMSILGLLLIITPEFLYLKDIYTTYFRANTMFKLVYQAFIILSLCSGYVLLRVFSNLKSTFFSFLYIVCACIVVLLVGIYPYFAISSYYNNLKDFHGLNGLTYLRSISESDYAAVTWMNSHIKGQPVIVEAQGDSYTDYERISSNTGLPTVFGWTVHEWLWRGTYSIVPDRVADVEKIYESTDISATRDILKKYHVEYVYVGGMEHTKYPNLNDKKFTLLGHIVYQNADTTIYKIDSL